MPGMDEISCDDPRPQLGGAAPVTDGVKTAKLGKSQRDGNKSQSDGKSTRARQRVTYLLGIYRLAMLRELNFQRGESVRSEFQKLSIVPVVDTENVSMDVDTPADAERLEARLESR